MKHRIIPVVTLLLTLPGLLQAAPWGPGPRPGPGPGPGWGPAHRPAPIGARRPFLSGPVETAIIAGITYFVLDGIFYRRDRDGYVVVEPPPGATIRVLPAHYRKVVVPPHTYYIADGIYYVWDESDGAYRIVEEPKSLKTHSAASGTESEAHTKIFVYPRKGQSKEQMARDRYTCHTWAVDQSGTDPTVDGKSVAGEDSDYRRAMEACLDARGYSMR